MKHLLMNCAIGIFAISVMSAAPTNQAADQKAIEARDANPNETPQLELDVDQTDTLAIPLDNSYEEEVQEQKTLERIQARLEKQAAAKKEAASAKTP